MRKITEAFRARVGLLFAYDALRMCLEGKHEMDAVTRKLGERAS